MHIHRMRHLTLVLCVGLAVLTGCSDSSGTRPGGRYADPRPGGSATGADWSAVTFTATRSASGDGLRQAADRVRERAKALGMDGTKVETKNSSLVITGPYAVAQLRQLGTLGELRFRPVLAQESVGVQTPVPQPSASPEQGRAATDALRADVSASAQASPSAGEGDAVLAALQAKYAAMDCSSDHADTETAQDADPDAATIACDSDRVSGQPPTKYLLGPAVLTGSEVASARATLDTAGGAGWTILLDFTSAGAAKFAAATTRLAQNQSPQNQFAIVIDGAVLSAPAVSQALTGGTAEISGNLTEKEAKALAAKLNSGSLPVPLTFTDASRVSKP